MEGYTFRNFDLITVPTVEYAEIISLDLMSRLQEMVINITVYLGHWCSCSGGNSHMFSNARIKMARCLANIFGIANSALILVNDVATNTHGNLILEFEHGGRCGMISE